jgi:hypothetical protein
MLLYSRLALLLAVYIGSAAAFGVNFCPTVGQNLSFLRPAKLRAAGLASERGPSVLRLSGGTKMSAVESPDAIRTRTAEMKNAAANQVPFSDDELDTAIASLKTLAGEDNTLDWDALRKLMSDQAHVSHKDWDKTEAAAADLLEILKGPDDPLFQKIMQRVLVDGNWHAADVEAEKRPVESKPWVVLVTGLNGIRKTSSVYQDWFKEVLQQALGDSYTGPREGLPDGSNSFFRQLDYMMATLANKDFAKLYKVEDINDYASLKDAIFQRYRKLAESLGVLLVKEAQKKRLNVMVEVNVPLAPSC